MRRQQPPAVDWRAVAAATGEGVGILEGGRFVQADDRLAEVYGFDGADELVGEKWTVLCEPSHRDRLDREGLSGTDPGSTWCGQVLGQRADGGTFRHALSLHRTGDGPLVWAVREVIDDDGDSQPSHEPGWGVAGPGKPDPSGSEQQYRRLFDAAPVPIGIFTAADGIVYCNDVAVELLGAEDREEIIGRPPGDFVHGDDRERVGRRIRQVIEGREPTEPLEERLVGLDGETRVAIVASTPATFDGEPAAQVVMNDVTEYRRTQTELEEKRRYLGGVMDAVDDFVYVLGEGGELYDWNDAAAETLEYSHEEIAELQPWDVIPEEHHDRIPGLFEAIDGFGNTRIDIDLLTKHGERLTHEFRGTTFEHPETGETVRCGVARDVTDQRRRERELARYETIVETVDDGVYAVDENLEFTFVNESLCEMFGVSREELLGTNGGEFFADEDEFDEATEIRNQVARRGGGSTIEGTVPTPDGERIFEARYRLHPEPEDGEYRGSVGVVRDVTERLARERELERQRDDLATLDRINEVLLETTREVIETGSRESVERTVCERLVQTDLYRFAWVGERELDGNRIVPRVSAGDDDGYLEEVRITTDGRDTGLGPVGRAMRTAEVQVAAVDDPAFGPWRDAATERGFASVAAVPLHDDGSVYGVLVVYSTSDEAFSLREQAGFDVLGRAVGAVIHAARNRELLFADAVVELEFGVDRPASDLLGVAADLGCELALDGYVSSGEQWILYVEVAGVPPAAALEALEDDTRLERARVVTDGEDGGLVELVVDELPLLDTASAAGATVRSATAEPSGARVVVEAPVDADVRHVVNHVQTAYPEWRLLATRERDREVSMVGRPAGLLDELTDRQHEALEAGYRSGYFDWPRESTAEEVAESLGLAPPTLHGHLRKAERAILAGLLDEA